ncbi:PD40 domain-containing protein [Jatrophihabitans sp. DSM 45814]
MKTMRSRVIALAVICVLAIGVAIVYLASSRAKRNSLADKVPSVATTSLGSLDGQPRIVFRNTALGDQNGFVAEVPIGDPGGPRAITTTECDRVYAANQKVLCLSSTRGIVTRYAARVLTQSMQPVQSLPLTGVPSRARLSHDATYASTTSFTAGDSYAATSFSTRTVISKVGGQTVGNLEDFTLIHDGKSIKPLDRNYWGVTFASDNNTFYATVEFSSHTWLVRGDLSTKTMTTLHEDAECPSLSPDGKSIVFKQRGNLPPGKWRLVRYDVATAKVTPLAETRSVDDQVDWLDNSTVIYGIPRSGTAAAIDDVWAVPDDGTGQPRLLIPQAWSPAVIH